MRVLVSALAFVVYDLLTHLDDEVRLITNCGDWHDIHSFHLGAIYLEVTILLISRFQIILFLMIHPISGSNTWCKWLYLFIRYVPIIIQRWEFRLDLCCMSSKSWHPLNCSVILGVFRNTTVYSQIFCADSAIIESVAFEVALLAVEIILIIRGTLLCTSPILTVIIHIFVNSLRIIWP